MTLKIHTELKCGIDICSDQTNLACWGVISGINFTLPAVQFTVSDLKLRAVIRSRSFPHNCVVANSTVTKWIFRWHQQSPRNLESMKVTRNFIRVRDHEHCIALGEFSNTSHIDVAVVGFSLGCYTSETIVKRTGAGLFEFTKPLKQNEFSCVWSTRQQHQVNKRQHMFIHSQ